MPPPRPVRASGCWASCRRSTTTCCRASPSARPRTRASSAQALAGVADVEVGAAGPRPRRHRAASSRTSRARGSTGCSWSCSPTARPCAWRARCRTRELPICLANIQPVPEVTAEWDMADLTYNQGIHGAQDTANAMVRAGRPFHVITDDWHADSFAEAVGDWARAAAAVTRWRALKVAVFGYAMNGMGDIRVDVHALLRTLGPQVDSLAPGALHRAAAGRERRRRARADGRRGRALRDRPAPAGRRARGPRADAARPRDAAARGRLRRLLDALRRRSPRTAASRACRSPRPRA